MCFCPLFQLLGKVGRRRHVPYANVLLKESHPPEAIEENLLGKYAVGGTFLTQTCYWQKGTRRRQSKKKLLGKYAAGGKRRKDCGERIPSGRKHKIPQKRIDISLIPAII